MAEKKHACRYACIIAAFVFVILAAFSGSGYSEKASISGIVIDQNGPVTHAAITIQGMGIAAGTDQSGRFVLPDVPMGKPVIISAWKHGYYSALVKNVAPPARDLRIELVRYQMNDNRRYEWIGPEGKEGCQNCHQAITEMSLKDAHMQSARNPRFLTMYEGKDILGNQSPPTRYAPGSGIWNASRVPQQPGSSKPYYGPGYILDFPGTAGNCTSCHIPGASIPYNVDPRDVKGADRYGVHCDFCHKVANVNLNPVSHMPHRGVTGVHAMDIRRPFTDDPKRHQLFFGTFEDAPPGDTKLPLFQESRYCAPCHFGVFWDTVVYNSYGEWLQSSYADPKSGKAKTCQECHMPSPTVYKGRPITNIAPGKGGIERNPAAIHNHNMTVDAELLRNSLTMEASAKNQNGKVTVHVTLINDKTGHHIPTDSPLRHMILLVEARDSRGKALKQLAGPKLPDWCGVGDVNKGQYSGLPGKAYAKLLKEKWTEIFPSGAYWNHTELVSDNRLAAFATDTSTYKFDMPKKDDAVISVKLLYRRAFIKLMEQKRWDVPDIVMARKQLVLMRDQ